MTTSPTQRTLKRLRDDGWPLVEVVERWNGYAKVRQDIFGFGDVVAVNATDILIVQATTYGNAQERLAKILKLPAAWLWVSTPSRLLEVWGWYKTETGRGSWDRQSLVVVENMFDQRECPISWHETKL
jgi:hypothetical protein